MPILRTPQTNPEVMQSDIDKEIDKWMEQYTDGIVLRNHYASEQDLEADWRKYMDQYYDLKVLSNSMAYRLYGMKNEEMYYKLKQWFLKHDIVEDKVNNLKYYAPKKEVLKEDRLNDEVDNLDRKAQDVSRKTGYYIITGGSKTLSDLNNQLYKFRSMGYDKKVKADTLSLSIYGMKNEEHYNKMMPGLLAKEPVPDPVYNTHKEVSFTDGEVKMDTGVPMNSALEQYDCIRRGIKNANSISEAIVLLDQSRSIEPTTIMEEKFRDLLVEVVQKKVIQEENEDYLGFAPYFLPDEMEELGVFSEDDNCFVPGKSSKPTDWFIAYQMRTMGLKPNMILTGSDWKYRIKNLYKGELTTDQDKQEMLELGWNPAIEPTDDAFCRASERANKVLRENLGYRFIDLTEEVQCMPNDNPMTDTNDTGFLGGILVIFTSNDDLSTELPSDIPDVLTSIDPTLKSLRPLNYGLFNTPISLDTLIDMAKGYRLHLDVYYMHFDQSLHAKLKEVLDFFHIHGMDFRFRHSITVGVVGRYKQLFIANKKLFCANLYNLILYAMEYGYQDPGAYLTLPMLSNMVGYDNKKNVYCLYTGDAVAYQPNQVLRAILNKNSSNMFDEEGLEYLKPYVEIVPVHEITTLPIDLDKDGNLLVRRRMKLDFAEEYAKCHKLLMQYSKAKGYEQMKYYVAKLWYMNILIEKRIHSPKKFDKETLSKFYKTRAHILSDFKKYMQEILTNEPNFNFQVYYHNTPFDKSTLKINNKLLNAVWAMFKNLVSPLGFLK